MKERPILFSGEMVRAILGGRKTQTRRVLKTQPTLPVRYDGIGLDDDDQDTHYLERIDCDGDGTEDYIEIGRCPYGKPGDCLWVRETWACDANDTRVSYRANGNLRTSVRDFNTNERYELQWKPSIHMPRWASRITLEIVSVRVERVQDIGKKDALAEGAPGIYRARYLDKPGYPYSDVIGWYAKLWDSINAKRGHSWESNSWVWVIEFKRF